MPSFIGITAITLTGIFVVPLLLVAGLGHGGGCGPTAPPHPSTSPAHHRVQPTAAAHEPTSSATPGALWDSQQLANAATIINTGQTLGVPERGWVIALATAIQESSLHNLNHGDRAGRDSRGLFQQRSAWGPQGTRMNPAGAATLFYQGGDAGQPGLLDIPNWQTKPLTDVAQAVQRSGHLQAYATHEAEATSLVDRLAGELAEAHGYQCLSGIAGSALNKNESVPAGYAIPADATPAAATAIAWALGQLGTPYSYGGDCTASHSGNPRRECDCSSLTQRAYLAAGIKLPRTTAEQVTAGTLVRTPADLQGALITLRPGDLIFIPGSDGTMSNPRHVGLFIGDGLLVESPSTGRDVQIATVASWMPFSRTRRPT